MRKPWYYLIPLTTAITGIGAGSPASGDALARA
jgi:hypothetical protein